MLITTVADICFFGERETNTGKRCVLKNGNATRLRLAQTKTAKSMCWQPEREHQKARSKREATSCNGCLIPPKNSESTREETRGDADVFLILTFGVDWNKGKLIVFCLPLKMATTPKNNNLLSTTKHGNAQKSETALREQGFVGPKAEARCFSASSRAARLLRPRWRIRPDLETPRLQGNPTGGFFRDLKPSPFFSSFALGKNVSRFKGFRKKRKPVNVGSGTTEQLSIPACCQ